MFSVLGGYETAPMTTSGTCAYTPVFSRRTLSPICERYGVVEQC